MAVSPPDDVPVWARGADPADIEKPPDATINSGWLGGVKPPHEWVNYWWNLVGEWADFASRTIREFDDLAAAGLFAQVNFAAGDRLVVFEDDNDTGPGVSVATQPLAVIANSEGSVDASGRLVAYSFGLQAFGVDRDFGAVATYAKSNPGDHQIIKTDGVITIACYGVWVEAFNATSGASIWEFEVGVDVFDLCISNGFVYIVHELSGGAADADANRHAHKLNRDTGAIVWSFQHSAAGALRSCCTNGRQLFVSGSISTFASGAILRAINASDGSDATGEGNIGLDTAGLSWDQVPAFSPTVRSILDCDGVHLYVGFGLSAAFQLEARSQADGQVAWGFAHPDGSFLTRDVAVDQDFVYAVYAAIVPNPDGFVTAHDKRTGAAVWQYATPGAGPPDFAACTSVVSDGQAIFIMGDDDDRFLRRLTRGNVPAHFRFTDREVELSRYRNWPLQPEEQ